MFASASLIESVDFTGKKLEGNVLLPVDAAEIKDGSSLKVELLDARKQDTASKTLAKIIMASPELKLEDGQKIPFSLDLQGDMDDKAYYTLSAVLNNGWTPKEGGDDWIQKGDFLTDTNNPTTLESCSKPDQLICKAPKDIQLVKYT